MLDEDDDDTGDVDLDAGQDVQRDAEAAREADGEGAPRCEFSRVCVRAPALRLRACSRTRVLACACPVDLDAGQDVQRDARAARDADGEGARRGEFSCVSLRAPALHLRTCSRARVLACA